MTDPTDPRPGVYESEFDSTREALRKAVRFLHLMQRRRAVVATIVLGAFVVAVGYYLFAPRYYESIAKLMVVQQTPDLIASMSEQMGTEDVMASQRELVKSRKVVQAAIARLRPEHRVDLLEHPPNEWVDEVSERLKASTIRTTNHMAISYQSLNPEAAAAVVSAVIEAYLEFVEKSHRSGAADTLVALTGERERLSRELTEKQLSLHAFRHQIGHLALQPDSGVVEPVISRALHFNDALVEAQQHRVELQASLATVDQALATGQDLRQHLSLLEAVVGQEMLLAALGLSRTDAELISRQQERLMQTEAELRRIAPYLAENHPQAAALTEQAQALRQYLASYHSNAANRFASMDNRELGPLLKGMLEQSVEQALGRERQLQASFEHARSEAVRQSGDLTQLQMLEREVQRIERQHDLLFDKIETIDINQVQAPIRVTAVEDPLPNDKPASPKLRGVLTKALLAGIVVACLVVYVQDLMDDRFGSPEEMAAQLGVPVLALVKQLKPTGGEGIGAVQMHAGSDTTEQEAFRTLRTALALSGEVSDRLIVSSAEPSDGKTTVTANLAVAFTQVGKRTLVIDADLRKPGMTALLELKGKPGVTDLLLAEEPASTVAPNLVRPTGLKGLDVIPAGPRRPDAAELLAGKNFSDLLAWAESRYDQVLVDCPPVLAVSDAQLTGRLADGVIVVVSPEKNHRRLVARACENFASAGVHVFGVVANRISEKSGGYGYGYGYGYSYGADQDGDTPDDSAAGHEDDHQLPRAA